MGKQGLNTAAAILFLLTVMATPSFAATKSEVRDIILGSRRLGPNLDQAFTVESLKEMSQKLSKDDIPAIWSLYHAHEDHMDVGAAMAMASLCADGITAIEDAAKNADTSEDRMFFGDVTGFVAGFDGCDQETRLRAHDLNDQTTTSFMQNAMQEQEQLLKDQAKMIRDNDEALKRLLPGGK